MSKRPENRPAPRLEDHMTIGVLMVASAIAGAAAALFVVGTLL